MMRLAVVLIPALVCVVFAAPAAAFQGPWAGPAVDLSATGGDGSVPQLAVAPDGTTTALWYRTKGADQVTQASTRPPGGTFGAAVDVSSAADGTTDGPRVAVAPDGTTTAIWHLYDGTDDLVQFSTRPPGGTFSTPVDLSAAGANAENPELAVAPDGTTTAVWQRAGIVQARTRPPGGTFGAAVDLSATGASASDPQIAVAPDGATTVVWARLNAVQASTRPPGGAFGAPVDVSSPGLTNNIRPDVAIAADGTTTAVWVRYSGVNRVVQASTRLPGGTFGAPVDLSVASTTTGAATVVAAPDGTTTAVWQRAGIVQAGTRSPGGAFGAPVDLSTAGQTANEPEVASAPDGTTTVVWARSNGANTIAQATTRPPGAAFALPADLSTAGQNAYSSSVAFAPDGTATAAWTRSNGADDIVQTVFTANPPTARAAPLISGSPTLGAGLACDGGLWTGAASVATSWLRAGTPIANGANYLVAPADQGSALLCRARAGNAFGSVEALSIPASIAAPAPAPVPAPARLAPTARSLPKITGTARNGRRLRCRPGSFSGASRIRTAWLRGSKAIKGATRTTYRLARKDVGKVIACRSTATGPGGTSTTISLGRVVRR